MLVSRLLYFQSNSPHMAGKAVENGSRLWDPAPTWETERSSWLLSSDQLSSINLVTESFSSPLHRIMLSGNRDNFNSSFPIWVPLISFSWLIALARSFNNVLNSSGESGQPCLIPDLSFAWEFKIINISSPKTNFKSNWSFKQHISYRCNWK